VLVTDHNVREMLKICARAYILNEGRVIAEGTPSEIQRDETVRRVYLGEDFEPLTGVYSARRQKA